MAEAAIGVASGDGAGDIKLRAGRGDCHCCEGVEVCSQQHDRELWSTIISGWLIMTHDTLGIRGSNVAVHMRKRED